jgi:uncharacterized protein YecE (DUF72 family)
LLDGTDGPRPHRVRFGPAGWSYRDWEGVVYPTRARATGRPVELLASLFETIEVNVTFYRDVPAAQLARWCDRVRSRPEFRWCFKIHQRFSHQGGIPAAAELLPALSVYETVRHQDRLGGLLLQFPWSLRPSPENRRRLAELLAAVRREGWPLVVEVRHADWRRDPGFAPVVCDQPALAGNLTCDEALTAVLATAPATAGGPPAPFYVRLHGLNRQHWFSRSAGRDARYDYLYTPRQRQEWHVRLERLAGALPGGADLYVIANNHFRGQAVVDALALQQLWNGRRPALPASLKQAYPDDLAAFPVQPEQPAPGRKRPPPDRPGDPPSLF